MPFKMLSNTFMHFPRFWLLFTSAALVHSYNQSLQVQTTLDNVSELNSF